MVARGRVLIEDVAVPRSRLTEMFVRVEEIGRRFGLAIPTVAHAGDGNLHIYACSNDLEKNVFVQQVDDFMSKLYAKTMELGGQISGEHGIGRGKIKYLAEAVGPTNIALMQGIKKVFDPKLLLNPGKVFTLPEA